LETLDRRIEEAIGRLMRGEGSGSDFSVVGDLTSQRVELTKPAVLGRIRTLLDVQMRRTEQRDERMRMQPARRGRG
jgi:hypothetical protein